MIICKKINYLIKKVINYNYANKTWLALMIELLSSPGASNIDRLTNLTYGLCKKKHQQYVPVEEKLNSFISFQI